MATYSAITPPASLADAIRPIGDLSEPEFDALALAVTGPRSFSLTKDELEALRNRIPPHGANVTFLIATLSFLYAHIARLLEAGMPYREAISNIVVELEKEAGWGDKKALVEERFLKLFDPTIHQHARKVQRLQSGFLPNAVAFATLVDLRPHFADRDTEPLDLMGYIPVIQFRISTDSPVPDEKQIVFQITELNLKELRMALERAERKLALIKAQPNLSSQIVVP